MKRAVPIIIVSVMAIVTVLAWTSVFLSSPGEPEDTAFVVAPGDGTEKIIDGLKEGGFVRSELFFKLALRTSGSATKLQPGTYDFKGADTYAEIIARLTQGGVAANEFTLKIIEGWNLNDIQAALAKAGYPQADRLFQVTGIPATDHRTLSASSAPKPDDFSSAFPYLKDKPSFISLEGYLFPDTYRIYRDATAEELTKTLIANLDRKLDDKLRQRIAAQGKTIHEVLTMASIVEREVFGLEDRRMVADLFWRRLSEGMALQADSTVNYATGKDLPAVTFEDLKNISRYNTYKYPGLPPGPIGSPGLEAIQATVDPLPNPYVYFLTDKEGNVHYGRTLEEHNRNKAKYLR
jgi:UPF0755 protein